MQLQNGGIAQEAISNDNRLLNVARYILSKGSTIDVPGGDREHKQLVWDEFTKLKGLVKRGTFTIDELEERIYRQYGIVSGTVKGGIMDRIKFTDQELSEEDSKFLVDNFLSLLEKNE